ncbi:MAG: WD40-repeat-containing domain protein [Benniella sp.]|nr:MAG: WD40-repeat-containing domain protein [Benniella sp.]
MLELCVHSTGVRKWAGKKGACSRTEHIATLHGSKVIQSSIFNYKQRNTPAKRQWELCRHAGLEILSSERRWLPMGWEHNHPLYAWVPVAWTSQEHELLSSTVRGTLVRWTLEHNTGHFTKMKDGNTHNRVVYQIMTWPAGSFAFSISMDRKIVAWDLDNNRGIAEVDCIGGSVHALDIALHSPGKVAMALGNETIKVWNTLSQEEPYENITIERFQSKVRSVKWHPTDEESLCFGLENGKIGIIENIYAPADSNQGWNDGPRKKGRKGAKEKKIGQKQTVFQSYHEGPVTSMMWCGAKVFEVPVPELFDLSLRGSPLFVVSCGEGKILVSDSSHPTERSFNLEVALQRQNPSWGTNAPSRRGFAIHPNEDLLVIGNADAPLRRSDSSTYWDWKSYELTGIQVEGLKKKIFAGNSQGWQTVVFRPASVKVNIICSFKGRKRQNRKFWTVPADLILDEFAQELAGSYLHHSCTTRIPSLQVWKVNKQGWTILGLLVHFEDLVDRDSELYYLSVPVEMNVGAVVARQSQKDRVLDFETIYLEVLDGAADSAHQVDNIGVESLSLFDFDKKQPQPSRVGLDQCLDVVWFQYIDRQTDMVTVSCKNPGVQLAQIFVTFEVDGVPYDGDKVIGPSFADTRTSFCVFRGHIAADPPEQLHDLQRGAVGGHGIESKGGFEYEEERRASSLKESSEYEEESRVLSLEEERREGSFESEGEIQPQLCE